MATNICQNTQLDSLDNLTTITLCYFRIKVNIKSEYCTFKINKQTIKVTSNPN